jgi:hypothetical protein
MLAAAPAPSTPRGRDDGNRSVESAVLFPSSSDSSDVMASLLSTVPWPEEVDELFFRELQYLLFSDEIQGESSVGTSPAPRSMALIKCALVAPSTAFFVVIEQERRESFEEAKKNGRLRECTCCFDDEVLPQDMIVCEVGHEYCQQCVERHATEVVGQGVSPPSPPLFSVTAALVSGSGRHEVPCMDNGCEASFPIESLQAFLRPQVVDLMLRRAQQEDVTRAGLENMVQCPFCDFAMILEDVEDKVFRCRNEECLKESCRQCRKANHVPLRCDEVKEASETQMRIFVENKMAEAVIRQCPSCGRR